jgi:hypothetical protein
VETPTDKILEIQENTIIIHDMMKGLARPKLTIVMEGELGVSPTRLELVLLDTLCRLRTRTPLCEARTATDKPIITIPRSFREKAVLHG